MAVRSREEDTYWEEVRITKRARKAVCERIIAAREPRAVSEQIVAARVTAPIYTFAVLSDIPFYVLY
jgi:hypothetical protein